MKLKIIQIPSEEPESILVARHECSPIMDEIIQFIQLENGSVEGWKDGKRYQIPTSEIFYAETVDRSTWLCLNADLYQSRIRLHELEGILDSQFFVRISKSVLVNLMKVEAIQPFSNGRFLALLKNGEKIVISRKYIHNFKQAIQRGAP